MAMAESGTRNDQWLFTEEEVNNAPSIEHGLSPEEERIRRAKGVNFLAQAGILLHLAPPTLGTAAVFFHRFFMRCSMVPEKGGIHHYNIAATALFLATKAEEHNRKTKDLIIAVARTAQKNPNMIIDEQSKEFWKWKDSIIAYEETMLELLTFDVLLQTSPHKIITTFLHHMQWLPSQKEPNRKVRDMCWAFVNDSTLSILCLIISPEDIGVAAIYFALKFTNMVMPDNDAGRPWWEHYGGTANGIIIAIKVMNAFYLDNPLKKPELPFIGSVETALEDLEKSRLRNGEFTPKSESTLVRDESSQERDSRGAIKNTDDVINASRRENTDGAPRDVSNATQLAIIASTNEEPGDSDAILKSVANDPTAHELPLPAQSIANGIKRGPTDDVDTETVSTSKRTRHASPPQDPLMSDKVDASEEGEI